MIQSNQTRHTTDDLILSTSKKSIEALTTTIGFRRFEQSAVSFLTDLTLNFMLKVCQQTQLLNDHVGARDTGIEDVLYTLNDFKITLSEINRYMYKTPTILPPINLPLFPVNINHRLQKSQNQLTEKEKHFRKINDIPDFLPPIWPEEKCKPKREKESTKKQPLRNSKPSCVIGPLKTATTSSFHMNKELPNFEIDIKMLPSNISWRSSSPEFILRNPQTISSDSPDKIDVQKGSDNTVCQNAYIDVSDASTLEDGEIREECLSPNQNVVENLINSDAYRNTFMDDDEAVEHDIPIKQKSRKRKSESYSKKGDDVKKLKPSKCYDSSSSISSKEKSISPYQPVIQFEKGPSKLSELSTLKSSDSASSISSLPKLRDVAPCKPLSSSLNNYKILSPPVSTTVTAAASECKPRQHSSSQSTSKKNSCSSQLSRIRKNIRLSNASVSSLPPLPSKPRQTAATNKNQKKTTKSSSVAFTPPPITGGKTIKMSPIRNQRGYKNGKSQTSASNANPRCELSTDNGIKMIIRLPKKV